MSREIKFRIWDKLEKKLISLNDLQSLGGIHVEVDGTFTLSTEYRFLDSMMIQEDAFDIQQFTGLQDKNGKDIYEGDVCEIKYINGTLSVQGEVIWFNNHSHFSIVTTNPSSNYSISYSGSVVGGVYVIGNIYETPDT